MRKIILLGGGGFIGNSLARVVQINGGDVLVLNRTGYCTVEGIQASSVDRNDTKEIIRAAQGFGADTLIDMIAFEAPDTVALLEALAGNIGRYVLISSCDVYAAFGRLLGTEAGKINNAELDENAPLRRRLYPFRRLMNGRYWYDKILLERATIAQRNVPSVILRLPMVFGPHDPRRRYHDLTQMLDSGQNTIILEEKFAKWISPHLHVDDVARAIDMAACHLDTDGQVFNIGPDKHFNEKQRAQTFAHANGKDLHIKTRSAQPGEKTNMYEQHILLKSNRLRAITGWAPQLSSDEAFQSVWEWQQQHLDR